jgi:DNA repair exonuclease SbcCD nuclease subunit
MRDYPLLAFKEAITVCVNSGVNFIIISGDLFDTSIPSIDVIRSCVTQLKKCKEAGISVYAIPGSHDFSPTGKTMLSVLEDAGFITNVAKISDENGKVILSFVHDKCGAKITGIIGRKSSLEKCIYENLDKGIEKEKGFKIFVFHSAIEDYRPLHVKDMAAVPLKMFPRGFDYYAGGHVHQQFEKKESGYGTIAFPGALFPTSFDELEKCSPGFYLIGFDKNENKIKLQWYDLNLFRVKTIRIDANKKSAAKVEKEILDEIEKTDLKNKIVLLRVEGILESGLPSEIEFKKIASKANEMGAKTFKKNTSKLATKEFEEISVVPDISIDELEKKIIIEHSEQARFGMLAKEQTINLITNLMGVLREEKLEGETTKAYEDRIKINSKKLLDL